MPLKRATDSAARATGAIERFIERTLAPRLEELAGELRGLRGEMQQLDKRIGEGITSLRNEMAARIEGLEGRLSGKIEALSARVDAVDRRVDGLDRRLSEAFDIRERLVALEAKVDAQKRNGA